MKSQSRKKYYTNVSKCNIILKGHIQAIIACYSISSTCLLRNRVIYLLPAALAPPLALQTSTPFHFQHLTEITQYNKVPLKRIRKKFQQFSNGLLRKLIQLCYTFIIKPLVYLNANIKS